MTQAMAGRERKRLERERKRRGVMVVPPVAVPPFWIEVMIDSGHLPAWDANDAKKVRDALEQYMQDAQTVNVTP